MTESKKPVYLQIDSDELARLHDCETELDALKTTGVDNWDGYGDAMQLFNEWIGEDKYTS